MNAGSSPIRGLLPLAMLIGLLIAPEASAQRSRGNHAGGHVARPTHVRVPRQTYRPPRMPQATARAQRNAVRPPARSGNARTHATKVSPQVNPAQLHAVPATARASKAPVRPTPASTHANLAVAEARRQATTAPLVASQAGALNPTGTTTAGLSPYRYTYGTGNGARGYRAYGYGAGYRNRYFGRGYGYGRSQGFNRSLIGRLHSVHRNLAQLDRDYQGHRVRAMHAISMAIRMLSHRSMGSNGGGFAAGMNNGLGMGLRRTGFGSGGRRSQLVTMPQAQSDARMSQALRTLQGINMQVQSQGSYTSGHAMAGGYIQRAIQELNIALSIR